MALRINLYHEVLLARRQEQYDPLKLSVLGMLVVAVALAGYYVFEMTKKSRAQAATAAQQAEFDRLQPLAKAAKAREDELNKQIQLAEKLTKRIEDRFYWAPVFEQITLAVPRNVQIYKLSAEVSGDTTRRCQMTIEGVAAGTEARRAAEELRLSIADKLGAKYRGVTSNFKNLDDNTEKVRLDGAQLPTSVFTINVSFVSGAEPEAKPAASAPGRRNLAQKN